MHRETPLGSCPDYWRRRFHVRPLQRIPNKAKVSVQPASNRDLAVYRTDCNFAVERRLLTHSPRASVNYEPQRPRRTWDQELTRSMKHPRRPQSCPVSSLKTNP